MGKIFKNASIFILVTIYALTIVNASSGISHFNSEREVEMRVVDSENALIGLPEKIEINYLIEKQPINYYKERHIEKSEDKNLEKSQEDLEPERIKEQVASEIVFEVVKDSVEIKVKNNLHDAIILDSIEFKDPNLTLEDDGIGILGSQREGYLIIKYENSEGLEGLEAGIKTIESSAILHFSWDGGSSSIHKDIIIEIEVVELEPKEVF